MVEKQSKLTQVPLPYGLGDLAPVMSELQMDFHYNKHHKTYVMKYNETLDAIEDAMQKGDYAKVAKLAKNTKFFGGGNWNHTFFWESLAPQKQGGGKVPADGSNIARLIKQQWGSFDAFVAVFNSETAQIQGSGWGWLVYNKNSKALEFRATANQDLITD